tara:strand:+ start:18477 stop:18938 length:462 start_codon:yes stop_codon:yes gene_type:complete
MSYVCEYKRGKRVNISRVGILSPMQARLRAQEIIGDIAKSGKTRYIPMNNECFDTSKKWHEQSQLDIELVFPSKNNKPFDNVKSSWTKLLELAGIKNFRWHDMRHHFASRLVMAGVDLNTVRELLGHSEISMTLRYAHFAPEHTAGAVAKLNY